MNIRPLLGATLLLSLSLGLAGTAPAQDAGPTKKDDQKAAAAKTDAKPADAQAKKDDDQDKQAKQQAADYAKAVKDLAKDTTDRAERSLAGLDAQTTRAFGGATRRCGCRVHRYVWEPLQRS